MDRILLFTVECTDQSVQQGHHELVLLERVWVERGDLEAVLQECWKKFFPSTPLRGAPFHLFTASSDVPITEQTLRPWLLGEGVHPPPKHPSTNLPHLKCGPTPTSGSDWEVHCIPHPRINDTLITPGKHVGATCRLYQCEPADNSFESLVTALRVHQQRDLKMHTYVMPLRRLRFKGAQKDYMCHYDNGVGILRDKMAIERALTLRQNNRPGEQLPVRNNDSPIFFADGTFSRFGAGFKNSAFHCGKILTVMTRHINSDDIMEVTQDTDKKTKIRDQLTEGSEPGDDGWKFPCCTRKPYESHAGTARARQQEWEVMDPKLPNIIYEATVRRNFFLQITSDLQEEAINQLLEDKGLCLAKDMRHTYFYLMSHSCSFKTPPRNPDRAPLAQIKWKLHIATSKAQGGDVNMEHFSVDEAPWPGWPDIPEGQSLESLQKLEDPSFRLLRFVLHYGTLQRSFFLPKTSMRVQDGLVFGFSHPTLKADGQEELPIHTVVLRYLPDAGFGNLKEQLGLVDSERVLDVYFKGRLVPLADPPIKDLDILTEALLRANNLSKKSRQPMERRVREKFLGQCFLQGANIPSLVDVIKVRNVKPLPLSNEVLKKVGREGLQLYAVDVTNDKQVFRPCSYEDFISDFALAFKHLEENLERSNELHSRLSPAQFGSEKWWREGYLYFGKLLRKKGASQENISVGAAVSGRLSAAIHLFPGSTEHTAVPGTVVAFKVSHADVGRNADASHYVGPHATAILRIQPGKLFGDKLMREVPITTCKSGHNPRTVSEMAEQAPQRLEVYLMDKRPLSEVKNICAAESNELNLAVFLKNQRGDAIESWIDPEAAPGSNTRAFFPALKVYQETSSQGERAVQQAQQFSSEEVRSWGHGGYKFVIPASLLSHCGKKEIKHALKHDFLKVPEVKNTLSVHAGNLHKLSVDSVDCTLGQIVDIPVTGKDLRGNPTQLHLTKDASISLRSPTELSFQVNDVKRVREEEWVVRATPLLSKNAPTLFGSGQDVDSLTAEGTLTQGPISGNLRIRVTPGLPAGLNFAPAVAAPLSLENGDCLPPFKLTATDEYECCTRLPDDWHAHLIVCSHAEPGLVLKSSPCTAKGAEITTPADRVDLGAELDRQLELQVYVRLSTSGAEEKVLSPTLRLHLQCSSKPRKVHLRMADHTIQPLAAAEVEGHLQRADTSWSTAGQIQSTPGMPVYLIKYPNPSPNEPCDLMGLHLDVLGDGVQVLEEVFVAVEPKPPRVRNSLLDTGDFAFLKTPALQEDQQYCCYKVTCSSVGGSQARSSLSFLILTAAVPPAPVMWQWQLSSRQDLGFSLCSSEGSRAKLPLAQPLAGMLKPQAVDGQRMARDTAAGTVPMVAIIPFRHNSNAAEGEQVARGLDVQLARIEHSSGSGSSRSSGGRGTRAETSSLRPLGCGPLAFSEDLCLIGKANTVCSLQLSGGHLQHGVLEVNVAGGLPEDFTVQGFEPLPSPGDPDTSQMRTRCASHEVLRQRPLILKDFAGNPATIPDAWTSAHIVLKISQDGAVSSPQLTPQGGLRVEPSNGAYRLADNFVLHLPISRLVPEPTPVQATFHLRAEAPRQDRSRPQHLLHCQKKVTLEATPSDRIVALLDLHGSTATSGSQLVVGNELPELLAWVTLRTESGVEVDAAELEEIASGIHGSLQFPDGQRLSLLCIRQEIPLTVTEPVLNENQEGHDVVLPLQQPAPASRVQLALIKPQDAMGHLQRSGSYSVTAEYIEQRPAVASVLQGSTSARINASSPHTFEVLSGDPVGMQLLNSEQELGGLNAANMEDRSGSTLLAQSLRVQLVDSYGNQAVVPDDISMNAWIERQQGPQQQQQQLPSLAQWPTLDIDEQSYLLLGPVQLTERSGQGQGSCVLELVLSLHWGDTHAAKRVPFTFYDTAGVGAVQVEQDRLASDQRHAAGVVRQLEGQRRRLQQEVTTQESSRERVWASARNLLEQSWCQRLLEQAGLTLNATQAVQSSDWEGARQVLVSLAQQLNTTQPPRYHWPAQRARQIIDDFKGGPGQQYAQEVLGLSLDLLVTSNRHARRLASWLIGEQVFIIVQSARAQSAMLHYLRELHPTQRPPRTSVLPLDMQDRTVLGQPPLAAEFPSAAYLAKCFKVKQEVPATDALHTRLLRALLRNVIMLPSLAVAQDYRQRVVRQQSWCPELVTYEDGQRMSSTGAVTVSRNDMDDVAPSINQLPAAFGSCQDDASMQRQEALQGVAAQLQSLPSISGRQAQAQQNMASIQTQLQAAQQRDQELSARLEEVRALQRQHFASTPQRPQNLPQSPVSSPTKRRGDNSTAGPSKHLRSSSSSRRR